MRMRWVYFILAVLLAGVVTLVGGSKTQTASFDYRALDRVLANYVDKEGRVDYAALKQNRDDLDEMAEQIASVSPATSPQLFPTREAQLAYWINAYNVWVLRIVVDNYPTKSITNIGLVPYGAFFVKRVRLGGKKMTLRSLENDIIRDGFHDPRIHFAINCASKSCPPLLPQVYRPDTLDEQLDTVARAFVNDNRHVTLDEQGKRIVLSKIFEWYASDFTEAWGAKSGGQKTVLDYLKPYLNKERLERMQRLSGAKITYHDYDWGLNDRATMLAQKPSR